MIGVISRFLAKYCRLLRFRQVPMWKAVPAGITCDKKATEELVCVDLLLRDSALRQREDNK